MDNERKIRPYYVAKGERFYCVYKYNDERGMNTSKVENFCNYDEARFFANKMNTEFVRKLNL